VITQAFNNSSIAIKEHVDQRPIPDNYLFSRYHLGITRYLPVITVSRGIVPRYSLTVGIRYPGIISVSTQSATAFLKISWSCA
jgi:hypothetical protein